MAAAMGTAWQDVTLGAEDYDAIRALWEEAGLHIRPFGRDSRAQFAAQMARGCQTVLGVRADGRLVGVVVATHDGRKGWINRLAVHPNYRRRGLARHLIAQAEAALRAQGMRIVAALVEDWNEASLTLFQAAGYVLHRDIFYLTKRESDDV